MYILGLPYTQFLAALKRLAIFVYFHPKNNIQFGILRRREGTDAGKCRGTHVLALVPPSVTDVPLSACSLFKQLWLLTVPSAALKPLYQAAVTISDTEFPPTRGFPCKSVPQFSVEDCDLRTSI